LVVSNHTICMKHTLSTTGLSLSQAASISNLCYQRAVEITHRLTGINNASKSIKVAGETYEETVAKHLPTDVVSLIEEKAKLHATQAFLMTNLKAKEQLLMDLKKKSFETILIAPVRPEFKAFVPKAHVPETWGWDQLTPAESCEFLQSESYAAHIGQFIHKDGVLDKLRRELPNVKTLEWISVKDGERVPVKVVTHHKSEDLLKTHEELAGLHRKHEQRVNYFKAKVKNLVSEENARISKENAVEQETINVSNNKLQTEFATLVTAYNGEVLTARQLFEATRQEETKAASALRISVDARFQETIDSFLKNLDPES